MGLRNFGHKLGVVSLAAMMAMTTVMANTKTVKAEERTDTSGTMGPITSNEAKKSADSKDNAVNNVVELETLNGKLRLTFLKDNEFRLNFEKTGNDFVKNAKPFVSKDYNKVFILDKYASDYAGVEPTITDDGTTITLETAKIILSIDKNTSLMKLTDINGNVKWEEAEPLKIASGKATQTLKTTKDEYFYGGGNQNGYFSHKNTKIKIEKGGGWEDGGNSNPVPFYMSTKGYGVMRHTFTPGEYNFSSTATFTHKEERFDAFYFVNDSLKGELDDFTELTGRPVFWPRWGQYAGHADCYNYNKNTGERDLNNQGKKVLDKYLQEHDVPLGWMLVNDGYGCHYGKTGTVDGNIQNLKTFIDNASSQGIETGLWSQSDLYNEGPAILRNLDKEVNVAGARAIKTDVAWVGEGYDMQMNSVNTAYQGIAQSGDRPFVFSLYGWAGSQRYAGIWTGDQTGGRWEYIRFMIPSYITSGLSGQPNVGSDIDSIYKGSKTIATRDAQWKAFTPMLYYMGGWDGSSADQLDGKTPWEYGTDSEAIVQFYLKTRAELTPYNYTNSYIANQTGTPMLRAMVLEYPNDPQTYGKETQYQYMWGDNLLVAPVYEGTGKDTDVGYRNNIYLPDENQTWIDYLTGKQYQGGQTLNNFDAPLWKLPLFVKSGAIIPMTEQNNSSIELTDDKDRIFNIYPDGKTSFEVYEDDGKTLKTGTATTKITSDAPELDKDGKANDGTATIKIEKRVESGYAAKDKATELFINTHKEPSNVTLNFNGTEQTLVKVTKADYQKAVKDGDDTRNIYYYDTEYNLAKYDGSEYINNGNAVNPGPRLVLRTVKTDVSETAMEVVVNGFNNSGYTDPGQGDAPTSVPAFNAVDEELITPTSITLSWNAIQDATSYDIRVNGASILTNVSKVGETSFLHKDLPNATEYSYEVRAANKYGVSDWSSQIKVSTKENPFKNSPENMKAYWENDPGDYSGTPADLVDRNMGSQYHSSAGATNQKLIVDMNYSYPINQFVYVPRQDYSGTGGNGVVQKLDLEVSIDGKTWKKVKDNYTVNAGTQQPMFNNVYADIMEFDTQYARYVRLTVKASVGTFFTAQEVIPCFVEGGKPRTAGTPLEHTNALSDADLIPMKMYSGSIPGDTTWNQVLSADVNYNTISDAYDLVNITSKLDGGIVPSKDKAIDGVMNVVMNKSGSMNTGDTVRVDVVGNSFKDINALSAELGFDNTAFEVVNKDSEDFFGTSVSTLGMVNYSRYNPHGSTSTNPTVYVDLANRGNKDRLNGDLVVGSFTLKAIKDNVTPNVTMSNVLIVNSNMVQKNAKTDAANPSNPEIVENRVARKDFTIDFSTPGIQHDDGTNLMQNGKAAVEALFDDNLTTTMEYKWSRPADEAVVILPLTMNVTFKEAKKITELKIYNRLTGNGTIKEMQVIGYKGDTAYDLGSITTNDAGYNKTDGIYTFKTEADKDFFDRVEVIAKNADNMTMLTLRELVITESNNVETKTVTLEPSEDMQLKVGKLKTIKVNVGPENALNKDVEVSVDKGDIASTNLVKDGEGNTLVMVQALKEGTAVITVSSKANPDVKATVRVNVNAGLDTTDYEKFVKLATAAMEQGDYYQKESQDALKVEYDKVVALDLETASQDDVDKAVLGLAKAYNALKVRETDQDELLKGSDLKADALYSESNKADRVLDDDLKTFWESPYSGGNVGLPKTVTLTLPEVSTVRQLDYVPAQSRNGLVTAYAVYVSEDGKTYTKVSEGEFRRDSDSDYSTQEIKFKSVKAKYVKFEVTKALGRVAAEDNKYARIAELRLYASVDATSIDVDADKAILKAGETKNITATLNPSYANDKVKWTSSDTAIATVSNTGVITGIAAGKATITVAGNVARKEIKVTVDPLRDIAATIKDMEDFIKTVEAPEDVYIKTTWDAFMSALTDAKASKATDAQATIDQKEQALKDAHANLLEMTSIEKLQSKIAEAEAITNDDATYSVGSFKALQKAIADAKTVAANPSASEEELAKANADLKSAIRGLANIKELRDAIDNVTMPEGDYSEASKVAFNKVLNDAKALLADENCKAEDVKASVKALTSINNKLVDVAELRDAITKAKEFLNKNADKFTPSYKASLTKAIAAAEKAMQDATTTKEAADALHNLKVTSSSPLYKGSKTKLETAVNKAAAIVKDKAKYTKTSYKTFETALANAKKVLADENATQSTIDKALSTLATAQKNLKKVSNNDKPNGGNNTTIKTPTGNVTVTGKLPSNLTLSVVEKNAKELSALLNTIQDKEVLRKYKIEKAYDIRLLKGGIAYNANQKMLVSIKLDKALLNKDLAILYIDANGKTTEMKSYVENGYIKFETTHFSTYAIASKNKDYNGGGVKTGDTTNTTLWMMLAVLGGGYIAVRTYKRSKKA